MAAKGYAGDFPAVSTESGRRERQSLQEILGRIRGSFCGGYKNMDIKPITADFCELKKVYKLAKEAFQSEEYLYPDELIKMA